ncbi:DUF1707 domain-containing protein [Streptomyces sp. AJS327]|uniref:DUF1707 SHOCT-like domain-containing protein n=1 Tax=Streptomyces sp. AJS327 TaxID=2545265 RepID=UPI0015E01AE3|nr:DUF1707 domain-containing protein [Streptomyces sp. AJS327]MBA0053963.1 DUF1707 domain-containing protein [Streptomyces sp. AJS327]
MTAEPSASSSDPVPAGQIRASHDEREAVVDRLRDAAAEGRIDLDELDTRVGQALEARTQAELAALTVDLPRPRAPEELPPLVLKGGMHGASRGPGVWEVPARVVAHGGWGGVKLDFSRARCDVPEVVVEAHGDMAGVTVVLPDGWAANTDGMDPGIGGLRDRTTGERLPGTPLIRLVGEGGMAGVVVRHPSRWERRRLRDRPAIG